MIIKRFTDEQITVLTQKFNKAVKRNQVIEDYLIEKGFEPKDKSTKVNDLAGERSLGSEEYVLFKNYKNKNKVPLVKAFIDNNSFFITLSFDNISDLKLSKMQNVNFMVEQKTDKYISKCFVAIDNIIETLNKTMVK